MKTVALPRPSQQFDPFPEGLLTRNAWGANAWGQAGWLWGLAVGVVLTPFPSTKESTPCWKLCITTTENRSPDQTLTVLPKLGATANPGAQQKLFLVGGLGLVLPEASRVSERFPSAGSRAPSAAGSTTWPAFRPASSKAPSQTEKVLRGSCICLGPRPIHQRQIISGAGGEAAPRMAGSTLAATKLRPRRPAGFLGKFRGLRPRVCHAGYVLLERIRRKPRRSRPFWGGLRGLPILILAGTMRRRLPRFLHAKQQVARPCGFQGLGALTRIATCYTPSKPNLGFVSAPMCRPRGPWWRFCEWPVRGWMGGPG